MTDNPILLAALALGAIGVTVAFAGRWRAGLGEWARALVISAFAVGATGYAFTSPNPLPFWISGFLVCAALHRWIDAVNANKPDAEASP